MDGVLSLQDQIFKHLYKQRMSSATVQGQFRVAPVIMLIDDAKGFYKFLIFIMNKLHSSLPEEMLDGHRERFSQLFNKLKKFYDSLQPYGYIMELVTIPTLPNFEPRFKSSVIAVEESSEPEPQASTAPPAEPDYFVTDLIDITADTPPPVSQNIQQDVWSIPSNSPDLILNQPGPSTIIDSNMNGNQEVDFPGAKNPNEDVWELLRQKDVQIKKLQDDIVRIQIDHNNEILQMQRELLELRNQIRNG